MGFLKNIFKFNNYSFKKLVLVFVFSVFLIQMFPVNSVLAQEPYSEDTSDTGTVLSRFWDSITLKPSFNFGENHPLTAQDNPDGGGACWTWTHGIDIENCVNQVSFVTFKVATYGVSQTGQLMDAVFNFTVIKYKERIAVVEGVMIEGWEIFRDLANIAFIFVLLYAAISIIIGINDGGAKKIVGRVIIIAILINFSYFLTSIVIDVSNRLAVEFHNVIKIDGGEEAGDDKYGIIFIRTLGIGQFYSGPETESAREYAARIEDENKGSYQSGIKSTTRFIIGTIFLLVAIFVFLAVSVLFVGRLVVLIFLLMLSPLAFVASVLPNTYKWFLRWIHSLLGQAFFAPVFFMLLWITIKIISSEGFLESVGLKKGKVASELAADAILGPMIGYSIAIGFLIFTLIAAKQMGMAGAKGVISAGHTTRKWGQRRLGGATLGTLGFAGRHTVGRGATAAAEAVTTNFGKSWWGRSAAKGLRKVGSSSMDVRNALPKGAAAVIGSGAGAGGYIGGVKRKAKEISDEAKELAKTTPAEQRIISQGEQKKKDMEKFIKKIEDSTEYKDINEKIKASDKEIEDTKNEIARVKQKELDAVAQGDRGAAGTYNDQVKHLEDGLKNNLANENKNLKTALDKIKDSAVKNNENEGIKDIDTFEDLEGAIKKLDNTIKRTKSAGSDRKEAKISSVGGLLSYISKGTLNRDRLKFATEKEIVAKKKKPKNTENKDGGSDKK